MCKENIEIYLTLENCGRTQRARPTGNPAKWARQLSLCTGGCPTRHKNAQIIEKDSLCFGRSVTRDEWLLPAIHFWTVLRHDLWAYFAHNYTRIDCVGCFVSLDKPKNGMTTLFAHIQYGESFALMRKPVQFASILMHTSRARPMPFRRRSTSRGVSRLRTNSTRAYRRGRKVKDIAHR